MRADEQQQRVMGQIVVALRESRLLSGARDVEYELNDRGAIVVDWVEGPYPREVAAGLVAYSSAGLLGIDAVRADGAGARLRASLLVGGVPVVLLAYEPVGQHKASRSGYLKRRHPCWEWPAPLQEEGAARDTVLWTWDNTHGTVATVIRLPVDLTDSWSESSILVASPTEDAPPGVWMQREHLVDRAREHCSILIKPAPRDWAPDEAEQWMTAELDSPHVPRSSVAVVWPDRCVLRRTSGLRVEATCADEQYSPSWSHVPAALLSSLWQSAPHRTQPPPTIRFRVFGDAYTVVTLQVASTWGVPAKHYLGHPIPSV